MEDRILLKEPMYKLFIKFVIPSVLAMLFVGIHRVVDGLFLGRFESVNAMSSVNIANPYMQLILSGCILISVGMVSRMGRMIGGNNIQETKTTFKTGFVAVSVWGFILLGIGSIFHAPLADFLGANGILFTDASRYIFVLSFFVPSICLMIVCGFSTHLMERPYLYVVATICCLATNILLDFLMIVV